MKPFSKSQLKAQRRILRSANQVLSQHNTKSKTIGDTCVELSRQIAGIERADIVDYVTKWAKNPNMLDELFIADIKRVLK